MPRQGLRTESIQPLPKSVSKEELKAEVHAEHASQGIAKVITFNHEWTAEVCTKFHRDPLNNTEVNLLMALEEK